MIWIVRTIVSETNGNSVEPLLWKKEFRLACFWQVFTNPISLSPSCILHGYSAPSDPRPFHWSISSLLRSENLVICANSVNFYFSFGRYLLFMAYLHRRVRTPNPMATLQGRWLPNGETTVLQGRWPPNGGSTVFTLTEKRRPSVVFDVTPDDAPAFRDHHHRDKQQWVLHTLHELLDGRDVFRLHPC